MYRTQYNSRTLPKTYEVNTKPSKTIPDQTMSLRELLERFARGLPINGQKIPIYEEDNDLPDPRTLDLAERQEFAEYARQTLRDMAEPQNVLISEPQAPEVAKTVIHDQQIQNNSLA